MLGGWVSSETMTLFKGDLEHMAFNVLITLLELLLGCCYWLKVGQVNCVHVTILLY